MPPRTRTLIDAIERAADATSYEAFREATAAMDAETGVDEWRATADNRVFDSTLLRHHTEQLTRLRERSDAAALAPALEEALYRHQGELSDARLYDESFLGPQFVVSRFWDEVERSIDYLASPDAAIDPAAKLERFRRAAQVFGRSALMLSGGGSLGFFHLGVIRALFLEGLLPTVLSGASMGAMIACGVASRSDDELRALFDDVTVLRTDALKMQRPHHMVRHFAIYDPRRLRDVILANNGDLTFAEAHARSGRIVNVSVSPTRERQKPRILCYLNAPDVTLLSAAMASSAVPGAFPPVVLEQRGPAGRRAYMGTETWIDGTFSGDVPTLRLGRLHGVNHFIVSQVNPHVAPVRRIVRRRGVVPFVLDAAASSIRVRAASDLDIVRRALAPTRFYRPVHLAHSLVDQSYGGDIDIHPRLRPKALARTFANISASELKAHVLEGERATWPLMARIRDQTRVERALARALVALPG
jgi:TAG lipase/steryl ester hydrolase/phospholipase A2/LPA acyltransferase